MFSAETPYAVGPFHIARPLLETDLVKHQGMPTFLCWSRYIGRVEGFDVRKDVVSFNKTDARN